MNIILNIIKQVIKLLIPTRLRIYMIRKYRYCRSCAMFYYNSNRHFKGIYDDSATGSKILFTGFEALKDRIVGFGDVFLYSFACYLEGKDMGYDDIHIVFPRFAFDSRWKVPAEALQYQKTKYMPWEYYPRNKEIDINEWDLAFDTSKENSLYGGFPGIGKSMRYVYQYFDIYYRDKGLLPLLDVKNEYAGKPYVLFQFRDYHGGYKGKERGTSLETLERVYDVIKDYLGNAYGYWKIGEPCTLDSKFDRVIPLMYDDIDGAVRIIAQSSLLVGSHSAPRGIAFHIPSLPIIEICMLPEANPYNEDLWRAEVGKSIVKRHPSWCDDRLLSFNIGVIPAEIKIIDFLAGANLGEV